MSTSQVPHKSTRMCWSVLRDPRRPFPKSEGPHACTSALTPHHRPRRTLLRHDRIRRRRDDHHGSFVHVRHPGGRPDVDHYDDQAHHHHHFRPTRRHVRERPQSRRIRGIPTQGEAGRGGQEQLWQGAPDNESDRLDDLHLDPTVDFEHVDQYDVHDQAIRPTREHWPGQQRRTPQRPSW